MMVGWVASAPSLADYPFYMLTVEGRRDEHNGEREKEEEGVEREQITLPAIQMIASLGGGER